MKTRILTILLCWLFATHAPAASITGSGATDLTAPGAIGGTTPSTGAFTTLSASTRVSAAGGIWYGAVANADSGQLVTSGGNSYLDFKGGLNFRAIDNALAASVLTVDAANIFAQRNGAADQAFRIYGLYTDASNYHYGSLAMSDTALTISTATLGTGVDNLDIVLTPSGTGGVKIGAGTGITSVLSAAAAIDFGSMLTLTETTATITVTGVVTTNTPSVSLGWAAALETGIIVVQSWVSGADTVTIRVRNTTVGTVDPASLTVRATVMSF